MRRYEKETVEEMLAIATARGLIERVEDIGEFVILFFGPFTQKVRKKRLRTYLRGMLVGDDLDRAGPLEG